MKKIEKFKMLIEQPGRVVITTHQKPDADALGSSLGLAGFLKKKGHEVCVITPTDYPNFLHWMSGDEDVVVYSAEKEKEIGQIVEKADLVFCLDFSSLDRINELGEMVRNTQGKKVLIDHHLQPEDFADFIKWDIKAAATAELIYDLIVQLGEGHLIDKDIAECLYAGIMTDTGNFKHPNTTENVFAVCGELVKLGADVSKVSRNIYDSNSVGRLRLLGHALSERLTVFPEYKTAFIALHQKDLQRFNAQTGDTEGFVNYALSITGVRLAALFSDSGDIIKISFRSTGDFSVNELARKYFNGGGHKNAAGGRSELPLEETINKFTNLLPECFEAMEQNKMSYAKDI
ncbi:MAG: bifunctional oligoribonuclease/PAP phosphatase NrnA [Cyclobacteriaceae bacterium]|nr:bifunctional oligoribonuclease/PAP phosphatase NrnA [Cyclobacteriaceae bacterium]